MDYVVYVLKSLKDRKTYVGYTNNLVRRLQEHNSKQSLATKHRAPFEVLFYENCASMAHAKKQELYWKSGGGRRKL